MKLALLLFPFTILQETLIAQAPLPFAPQAQIAAAQSYAYPTGEEKKREYLRDIIGPGALFGVSINAAVDHLQKYPPEWGQGPQGFSRRFGSYLGENLQDAARLIRYIRSCWTQPRPKLGNPVCR